MEKMEVKFLQLLAESLEKDKDSVKMSDKFREYEEWDSLSLLSVLATIEEQYEVIIPRSNFKKSQTVEDLYNYIMDNKQNE